ncbi:ATP-binding protein [Vibrio parahaemolyticus]|uniref:AAA family ATPase n=1 Tax=Vibrio parahaemolyticus TaxID=670 RepID=UPI00100F5A04|nr:AAA family ATPase [Vibrio parahaemolyticus]RXQ02429.1 ATP-binding protein [Vibrio parahaemolyticus]
MRINSFFLKNHSSEVHIEPIDLQRFNILVGISGAGKTTIIQALEDILHLAKGNSELPLSWEIDFTDDLNRQIQWSGETSKEVNIEVDSDGDKKTVYEVLQERLIVDGKNIIKKNDGVSEYKGNQLPSLDRNTSLFYQLRNDETISSIHTSLLSVVMVNEHIYLPKFFSIASKKEIERMLEKSDCSKLDAREKLFWNYNKSSEKMKYFNDIYSDIFPSVSEIIPVAKGVPFINEDDGLLQISIDIKLKDEQIVKQKDISSGMFKSLVILSEIIFGSTKSPIVIDEIENGLGVNCLQDILDELDLADNQVILTTHHPKIINKISPKLWKIVTRLGNKIKTSSASEVLSGKHDPYIQLINSAIYNKGSN